MTWHGVLTVIIFGGFAVLVIAGIRRSEQIRTGKRPPPEPRTDFPPFLYDVIGGTRHPCYTAPARAVTPAGIAVRQARCCAGGHRTPAQAVACAGRVSDRIARTGR
jgi:hypothetical protein